MTKEKEKSETREFKNEQQKAAHFALKAAQERARAPKAPNKEGDAVAPPTSAKEKINKKSLKAKAKSLKPNVNISKIGKSITRKIIKSKRPFSDL